jgi:hypothetical protein
MLNKEKDEKAILTNVCMLEQWEVPLEQCTTEDFTVGKVMDRHPLGGTKIYKPSVIFFLSHPKSNPSHNPMPLF